MKVYRCDQRFFCGPLGRYLPIGAMVARYENATRLVVDEAPRSDLDPLNVLVDGVVYDDPADVTWFYGIETDTTKFTHLSTKTEDSYGNVSGEATGGGGGVIQGTSGTYDLQPTDAGVTAGDARGENTVDLCTERSDAAYVCAGANSGSLAGENVGGTGTHTAYLAGHSNYGNTGNYCSIAGFFNTGNIGNSCSISGFFNTGNEGENSLIAGTSNSSNTGKCVMLGGKSNTSNSGDYCNISGNGNANNSANYSVIGGRNNDDIHVDASYSLICGETNSKSGADVSSGSHCIISGENNYRNSGNYCSISGYANYGNNLGHYCSISGGWNHGNEGDYCSISGASNYGNEGDDCLISGSFNHTNSGTNCSIVGDANNTNIGDYCAISGRQNNNNNGDYCVISGRLHGSNNGDYCLITGHAASYNELNYARVHGGNASARIIDLVAQITSSGTAATELLLGGSGGTRIIIPDQSAWAAEIHFVAKTSAGSNASMQVVHGLLVRDDAVLGTDWAANAVQAAQVDIGTTNATFAVDADDTNEALLLTVTVSPTGTVKCSARVHLTQIDYTS